MADEPGGAALESRHGRRRRARRQLCAGIRLRSVYARDPRAFEAASDGRPGRTGRSLSIRALSRLRRATRDQRHEALGYRTTFGKARLRSQRFYSHCCACGFRLGDKATVSPLAHALPQRVHPQWSWLQCRYASVMSYRLAQIFLRDAFPGGSQLPISSVKVNVRKIGDRLEKEALGDYCQQLSRSANSASRFDEIC